MRIRLTKAAWVAAGLLVIAPCFVTADEVTIKVLSSTIVEGPEGKAEQKYADEFMALNPDVTIEFIGVPANELYAKTNTMAIGGSMPDVFINSPEFMAQANDLGIVADLEGIFGEEYFKGFAEGPLSQAVMEDKYQFLPWFTIPVTLLYRSDIFEESGIEPPKTWSEFRDVAKKLTVDTDDNGEIDRWGFAMIGTNNGSGASRFFLVLRAHGAAELVPDGESWTTQFDSDGSISAFQLFHDLVNVDESVPPGPLQTGYGEAVSLIATGKAAMMITGPHTIGAVLEQNPDLDGKLAGALLPSLEGVDPDINLGMFGWAISESSENKEVAAEYIKFVLNKENQIAWNAATGRLPTRTDALSAPEIDKPMLRGFVAAAEYGYQVPTAKFYPEMFTIAGDNYQAVIAGEKTAEEAASDAASAAMQTIANNQ
jgi:ABC-type glycerol-3-phosphate transport system substrate-binding protein